MPDFKGNAGPDESIMPIPEDHRSSFADDEVQIRPNARRARGVAVAALLTLVIAVAIAVIGGRIWLQRQQSEQALKALGAKAGVTITDEGMEIRITAPGGALSDADFIHIVQLHRPLIITLTNSPKITDKGLEQLRGMSNIVTLEIARTGITDSGLAHVGTLAGLQSLDLASTKITSAGMHHLEGLSRLRDLALEDTDVGDQSIESLKHLTGLEYLLLSSTKVSHKAAMELKQALPKVSMMQ